MKTRMMSVGMVVTTALALLGGAAMAGAQDREGRWEFSLGALYQLGTSADFEGGSTMDTDDEFGFVMTGGYNLNDRLATNFGFQYAGIGYDATVIQDDGGQTGISGSYDTWAFSGNLILNLMEGSVTPYVGAGIGWTWVDTNIPNGLPTTGCWWDPWWGYICYTTYPTKQTNAFSYQATVGLRYEFDYSKFLRLGYTSQWMDIGTATGDNLRFDVFALEFGWMF